MGMANHEIQIEVQKAITSLVWTVMTSSSITNAKHRLSVKYASTGDSWPSGVSNVFADAKSSEISDWANSAMAAGTMSSYGQPIYAVGGMFLSDYVFYGARAYGQPVLENVCDKFAVKPSIYLAMRHYAYPRYDNYQNHWYTHDYKEGWADIQTAHVVFLQELNPSCAGRHVGDYPFYDKRDINPVTASPYISSMDASSEARACDHVYCDKAYWLLKWDASPDFTPNPPQIAEGAKSVEDPDVDRDDIVEVPVDMQSLGNDSGSIYLLPECDNPAVLLPLASTPEWFGSLPVHAYLSQGAFTNLPYQYHIKPHADNDGYYTAYSLNTHIEGSGAVTNEIGRASCRERV